MIMGKITITNEDNINMLSRIKNESIDVILTDPPYLYLKNQKLEREFDEQKFFEECKRILTKNGFIVMFGRGTSFYRWNTILADLGFNFKEEIVWDKSQCTSPLMALSRIHETVSIFTKGKGTINKVKVPYLEMKSHDLDSIITDIKRLKTTFKNTKSLDAVLEFLENNMTRVDFESQPIMSNKSNLRTGKCNEGDRCVTVINSIANGLNEKSIIRTYNLENVTSKGAPVRTDRTDCDTFTKFEVNADKRQTGDRCVNAMQSICFGLNEKSIIKQTRDHYTAIHPTQKPVRLLERLLALVIPKNKQKEEITVLDPFGGSFSTMEAAYNMGMNGISCEIDKEYFEAGKKRIEAITAQQKLF